MTSTGDINIESYFGDMLSNCSGEITPDMNEIAARLLTFNHWEYLSTEPKESDTLLYHVHKQFYTTSVTGQKQ